MSRRKYTHIQALEQEILRMRQGGATRQEIADRFGLSKSQVKNWINRYNHKQAKIKAGITPRPKGRPRKDSAPGDIIAEQAAILPLHTGTRYAVVAADCNAENMLRLAR